MYGSERAHSGLITEAQAAVHDRLLATIVASCPEHHVQSPREAAHLLLGAKIDYGGTECCVEPYDSPRVSLPSGAKAAVRLLDALPARLSSVVQNFESQMLADEIKFNSDLEIPPTKPYFDESMRRDRAVYLEFLGRCWKAASSGSRQGEGGR